MAAAFVGGWLLIAASLLFDPDFAERFWPTVAISSPGFVVAFVLTLRRSGARSTRLAATAATLVWGAAVIHGSHVFLGAPELGSIGLVVVALYGFQVFRIPSALFVPAVMFLASEHIWLLWRAREVEAAGGNVFHASLAVVIVLASLLIGYVNDGAERREFEQLETIHQQQQIIDAERERAERLLHQVLPAPIVARLKQSPGRVVQRHEAVTVMFADVVDFTALSVDLPAEEVVSLLDALFRWIDGLAAHHGVEKIKTIGDAYMAVAGAPDQRDDHAEAVAMLALDIQADLPLISRDLPKAVEVRIGMASGPAVAGLIGETRFTYDLWSDTVNTAARMQTSASPGSIHVDAEAARLLGGRFVLQEQHVDLKGKGSTTAWSLHGVRPRSLGS